MATLEKIRSKSVLLLIIIAVALLAFILGDFFTSGRTFFGTGTTIAKVDGQRIDVTEFQKRVEKAQANRSSNSNIDGAVLQQQVLDQMITEKLLEQEYKKLGIKVTDSELTNVLLGDNSMYFDQMVAQQTGMESAAALHDMAFNPTKYDLSDEQASRLRQYWMDLEKQAEEMLLNQKLQNLFVGSLQANKLDAKAMYDEGARTSTVAFVKANYMTLPDSTYKADDAEINKEWASKKNFYRLEEPTRIARFIEVKIEPSRDDLAAASVLVEEAVAGLNTKPGTEGLEGMTQFIADRKSYAAGDIKNRQMKAWLDTARVGTASVVSRTGNDYVIAKLLNQESKVDKVTIDYLAVALSSEQVDSILGQLNAGTLTFDQLAANPAVQMSQDSTELSLINPQLAQLRPVLLDAQVGRWFTPDTAAEGNRIFRVRSKSAPVNVYEVAEINFAAEPSAATVNSLEADLSRYVKENATVEAFVDNAMAAGYNVQKARVTESSAQLGNLNDSRNMIVWVENAKKGQVSGVFGDESTGRYAAVALEQIYDDYVPSTDEDVATEIGRKVMNDKKAAALREKFDGKAKDLAGYAQLMGSSVDTVKVNFSQPYIQGMGINENKVQAEVLAAKPGQLVGPIDGTTGLIYLVVTNVEESPIPYDEAQAQQQFVQQRGVGALSRNISGILKGNKKVKNNTLKFYN